MPVTNSHRLRSPKSSRSLLQSPGSSKRGIDRYCMALAECVTTFYACSQKQSPKSGRSLLQSPGSSKRGIDRYQTALADCVTALSRRVLSLAALCFWLHSGLFLIAVLSITSGCGLQLLLFAKDLCVDQFCQGSPVRLWHTMHVAFMTRSFGKCEL